ncbi:MAG: single-stranded DNA-binding protein [Pseudomonadota bacterium]
MSSLNRADIIGNLGADPDVRSFQNGGKVANISVATTRKWRDRQSGEDREDTEWHRVSITSEALAGLAEKYLRKGSKVFISGRLKTRKWQDQSGQDRYTTEIIVAGFDGKLTFLDGRRSGDMSGNGGSGSSDPGPQGGPDIDDEIPF